MRVLDREFHVLFSLDYNRIGDSGGSAIGQALESNRTLVTLRYGWDLSNENFGHEKSRAL